MPQTAVPDVSSFLRRVLVRGPDIRAVWSIGHAHEILPRPAVGELLVFADHTTLRLLRKCDDLHHSDMEVLVVVDGDRFESAWGKRALVGSLARWAWRQVGPDLAYYDVSSWGESGRVLRVRRRAELIWARLRNLAA